LRQLFAACAQCISLAFAKFAVDGICLGATFSKL
jgi:hypothetical protein